MKAKEMVAIFDAACRQLKMHFGAEAKTIKIVKAAKYPHFADHLWVAACESYLSLDCKLSSEILVIPTNFLQQTTDLNDEILRNTIVHAACHEMAHHLSRFRMTQIWKQELAHLSPANRYLELKSRHNTLEPHGSEWRSVMENEMSVNAHISLTPYPELSPIVRI